jgi:hypothetical protein
MRRPLVALTVAVGLVVVAAAGAETPKVISTSPFGARRGEPLEVTILGTGLEGKPRLVAPFPAEVVGIAQDAASWKARITPGTGAPVGVYVCRVRTDDGLSNPFLFAIGQVPQVGEKEENSTFDAAQTIPTPVVVEGQVAGNDVDFFRFSGKKNQRIVVDAQCSRIGSGVDPTLRLTTAGHGFVAAVEDTPGLLTDARLTATLPEDGDYVIELSDSRYQGAPRAIYRLLVGSIPVADEIYPLGGRRGETVGLELRGGTLPQPSIAAATLTPAPGDPSDQFRPRITGGLLGIPGLDLEVESLLPLSVDDFPELRESTQPGAPRLKGVPPVVFNGRLGVKGEEDSFLVEVVPGQRLRIEVEAASLGSALDGVLNVLGANGAVLATADDTAIPVQAKKAAAKKAAAINSPDPSLNFTVPAGVTEIRLALRDLRGDGGSGYPYRITVEPIASGFHLTLAEDQINIPLGGTAAVGVEVTREGYDGPIQLNVANPPPGVTTRPGLIGPGQAVGSFTVSASPDASFEVASLQVVGEAKGPNGPLVSTATRTLTFASQATLPTNVVVQEGLPAAVSLASPIGLDTAPGPIIVAHGTTTNIPIKATRSPGTEDAVLTFQALPMPGGLTIPATKLEAKATEAAASINAAVEAPLGACTIALQAKGAIAGKERLIAIPAVTIEVVRPAALELSNASVEIKAGATVELKGKVARRGAFNEPATVKIDTLPAGLKADPVTVPPGQSDFTLKILADAKAAPAQATAQATLAFQINKKDYPPTTSPLAVKVVPGP